MNQESRKKRVVVIGGGNGAALSLLALKSFVDQFSISAVISMSDSGGSSGRLRDELGVLPPGDILRAVLALSRYDGDTMRKIFYEQRFQLAGKLEKHNLGNIFLALVEKYTGDVFQGIQALEEALGCIGHAFPSTSESAALCAELADGSIVKGETKIDKPKDRSRIVRAWFLPAPPAFSPACDALCEADAIILGPGDLYTSIIAALLPAGIKEAIAASRARIICVVGNTYKVAGEAGPTALSEFVAELEQYLPRPIDTIICDARVDASPGRVRMDKDKLSAYRMVDADLEASPGVYDPERLGKIFREVIL